MTAQSDERTGGSEVNFGGKSDLNLTSCEDPPKVGGDCNGIVHDHAEEIDVESKDGGDVFVNDDEMMLTDTSKTDPDTRILVDRTEDVGGEAIVKEKSVSELNASSPREGEQVNFEELNVEEGEKSESCNEGSVVSSSKLDDTAEDSEYQTNGDGVEKSGAVEEEHKLDSAAVVEGNQESLVTVTEAVGSEPHQLQNEKVEEEKKLEAAELHHLNNREGKIEQRTSLDSVAEIEENQDCSQNTVPEAVESELHQIENGEEKVEGEDENQESQHTVESEIHQLDNEEGYVEEHSELDSAEVEDQDSHIMATMTVELELHQRDKGVENETEKLDTESPVEEPSGHVEAKQEINLEMATCPVDDAQLETDATKDTYESGENVPICPVEPTISETEAINDSAEGQERTPMLPVDEIGSESSNLNESLEKTTSLHCPADDMKSELDVGDTSVEGGKSLPTGSADCKRLESEIGDASVERDESMSACSVGEVKSEDRIGNGSIESDRTVPTTVDTVMESEATDSEGENVSAASSKDMPSADAAKLQSVVSDSPVVNGEGMADCINDVVVVENGEQSLSGEADGKLICAEVEGIVDTNGGRPSSPKDSTTDALEGQKVDEEVEKMPFRFLIRIPRYVDDKIRDQIRLAQLQVDEKTRSRDAIRSAIQSKRAICGEYHDKFEAARSEERAARDVFNAKRQEMDSVQSVINRMKNATSIEDIADKIYSMEHMIEHETMPLKEEKQLIREIKQLKHLREQICSSMGGQTEVQPTLDQRDRIEERFKILKQELDSTRNEVLRTEGITKASRKMYFDESDKLRELHAQHRAADDLRQEEYTHLQNLKKQLYEKNKYFRIYKEDVQKAQGYAFTGDKEALRRLCVNQVETIMELWNNNDEFRSEYIRCNTMSTLRRLKTLDGRSLGPDEEPSVLRNAVDERVGNNLVGLAKANSTLLVSTSEGKSVLSLGPEKEDAKSVVILEQKNPEDVKYVVKLEQKNSTAKSKRTSKPAALENGSATLSVMEEKAEEENKQTKEEEELARKAEELRKEEAATKLKEQRRLEEKAKAKEAEERKRRNAEKAQNRAELKAQKEAEVKEKEKEKRMKKKERKKAAAAAASGGNEGESASISEENAVSETTTLEPEIKEKALTVTKRPQKPSLLARQTKTKALPPPLRNRNKRRMQPWMWVLLIVLVVLALFLVGSSGFSSKFRLSSFGL